MWSLSPKLELNDALSAVLRSVCVRTWTYALLSLQDLQSAHVEAEPLCVLDFYVVENLQRHGYGLELFDFMLQVINI